MTPSYQAGASPRTPTRRSPAPRTVAGSTLTLALTLTLPLVSCAPKRIALPTGPTEPFAGYAEAMAQATAGCRDVNDLTAELGLSGRVGRLKLRGRAVVGLAAPDRIRLEGLAPFGQPIFILASSGGRATLLLPRDRRVLRDEPAAEIVEALTGVRIDPASLRAALAGCGLDGMAESGERLGEKWAIVQLGQARRVYLEETASGWVVLGASTPEFTVTYDERGRVWPRRLSIRSQVPGVAADVRLQLSQVEFDAGLGPEAFQIEIPGDADPLTLDELREAGPLGERRN